MIDALQSSIQQLLVADQINTCHYLHEWNSVYAIITVSANMWYVPLAWHK